jgi:hypothetical protein
MSNGGGIIRLDVKRFRGYGVERLFRPRGIATAHNKVYCRLRLHERPSTQPAQTMQSL